MLATVEVACFYWAVAYLPLADVMAYYLAGPIFVTAIAGALLREPVGWRRWSAVIVGFVGVIVCLRPGSATLDLAGADRARRQLHLFAVDDLDALPARHQRHRAGDDADRGGAGLRRGARAVRLGDAVAARSARCSRCSAWSRWWRMSASTARSSSRRPAPWCRISTRRSSGRWCSAIWCSATCRMSRCWSAPPSSSPPACSSSCASGGLRGASRSSSRRRIPYGMNRVVPSRSIARQQIDLPGQIFVHRALGVAGALVGLGQ